MSENGKNLLKLQTSTFLTLFDQLDMDTQRNDIVPKILKGCTLYLLFNTNVGLATPVDFGIEHMFVGVYLSFHDAFKKFIQILPIFFDEEEGDKIEQIKKWSLNDIMSEEEMKEILKTEDWKIISCSI